MRLSSQISSTVVPRVPSPALALERVHKSYRAGLGGCRASVAVLRGVSLRVAPGEVVGIAGEIGAGKTTLLLCAAGLLLPDQGAVRWLVGRDARGVASGFVAESPRYGGGRSVREILARHVRRPSAAPGAAACIGTRTSVRAAPGADAASLRSLVWSLVRRLALGDCLERRTDELGRGVLQRVALVEAVASGAQVLFLDGTLAALGAIGRDLIGMLARCGIAVVAASAHPSALVSVGARVLTLDGGVLRRATASLDRSGERAPWAAVPAKVAEAAAAPTSLLACRQELSGAGREARM